MERTPTHLDLGEYYVKPQSGKYSAKPGSQASWRVFSLSQQWHAYVKLIHSAIVEANI